MRSGKPPAPWARRKRRKPRVAVIAVLVLVFAAVGAYALWRLRPEPLPWNVLGADRIDTPALDMADEVTRSMLRTLRDGDINRFNGAWLGDVCSSDRMAASEVYVLSRGGIPIGGPMYGSRVVVTLGRGGEATFERYANPFSATAMTHRRRTFDEAQAEAFRGLLVDGAYSRMTPGPPGICDGETITLESCVHGRYFGIVRACETVDDIPALKPLAAAIEVFATEPPRP